MYVCGGGLCVVCVNVKCVCMFFSDDANTLQELRRTSVMKLVLLFGLSGFV